MFKSSKICSFGSTINNLGSYHFGAYIGWWNFLMGVLTMNGTDLFGHFNLELDEINPWTFLDTFRNLIFLSASYQAARQSLHKMWLWIIKLKSYHPGAIFWPECDYLPIKTDTRLNYISGQSKGRVSATSDCSNIQVSALYWLLQFLPFQEGRQN